jgi:hypothetical protein
MMSCYERTSLSQFMREEGRLKYFCRREIQTSAMDISSCPPANVVTVLSCLDDLDLNIDGLAELAIGPEGRTEEMFFGIES